MAKQRGTSGSNIIFLRKLKCTQASKNLTLISLSRCTSMQTRPGFRHLFKSREDHHLSFAVIRGKIFATFASQTYLRYTGLAPPSKPRTREFETNFESLYTDFIQCDLAVAHLIRCRLLVGRRKNFETEFHLIRCRLSVRRGKKLGDENST